MLAFLHVFIVNCSQHLGKIPLIWVLWGYLLTDADDFERHMGTEHVEDNLVDKRVFCRMSPGTYPIIFLRTHSTIPNTSTLQMIVA